MGTEIDEYNQKAQELRKQGRLDEAVLAARKATDIDPENANAWWQLALTLEQQNQLTAALRAFEKVTTLAPRFAAGWCEMGVAQKKLARIDKAIACYEAALKVDPEHERSLKLLETALGEREGRGDDRRRVEVLRALQQTGSLTRENQFRLPYLLAEQCEHREAARGYEAFTRQYATSGAYYNLGLAYEKLGRRVDAIDVYRTAARLDASDTKIEAHIRNLTPSLISLRRAIAVRPESVLRQEDWYQHYINPFALLNVDDPSELRDNPRELQKARQALLREIELEDGKLDWMPGLTLDKSTALSRLEPLNNETQWDAHETVFYNPLLCNFLMRGNLEHFLAPEDPSAQLTLAYEIESAVLEVIGPSFARQYDGVLAKAIEQGDLEVIECLADGRRWVLPEQEERCFESARRAVSRLQEPLVKLAEESSQRTVGLGEVQQVLAKGSLGRIMAWLPAELHEEHAAYYGLLRDLSVSLHNKAGDTEAAVAVLKLGTVSAAKSAALTHQLGEDEKALNEQLTQAKKNEVYLTVGGKPFHITRAGVTRDKEQMAVGDMVGVRWGLVFTSNTSPRMANYHMSFIDTSAHSIDVTWTAKHDERQQQYWNSLVNATIQYLMDDIVANFKRRLQVGAATWVGGVEVVTAGVHYPVKSWLTNKRVFCSWKNLASRFVNGDLVLSDVTNRRTAAIMPLHSTDNAILLHLLAEHKED
ncbi:tetratricopeptide repeat protein [Paraburkholderia sp. Ac-20336]|uniref:tetratricopeptide repeat protein n=1 Tax=Paraburkholderia sp. Ac-20336 TaxID=2703886 RepID=UPI00197E6C76|nr:tetratricopeptide repeat protein [Paraburkholderia sp. Ac-20336]MBN3801954.1 tetratricopeptide repeat protein [Paraburkholderia sp. Ac-20336]